MKRKKKRNEKRVSGSVAQSSRQEIERRSSEWKRKSPCAIRSQLQDRGINCYREDVSRVRVAIESKQRTSSNTSPPSRVDCFATSCSCFFRRIDKKTIDVPSSLLSRLLLGLMKGPVDGFLSLTSNGGTYYFPCFFLSILEAADQHQPLGSALQPLTHLTSIANQRAFTAEGKYWQPTTLLMRWGIE